MITFSELLSNPVLHYLIRLIRFLYELSGDCAKNFSKWDDERQLSNIILFSYKARSLGYSGKNPLV